MLFLFNISMKNERDSQGQFSCKPLTKLTVLGCSCQSVPLGLIEDSGTQSISSLEIYYAYHTSGSEKAPGKEI